jgi:hypothetical protein
MIAADALKWLSQMGLDPHTLSAQVIARLSTFVTAVSSCWGAR